MSIRYRVRVVNHGVPLEETRDDPELLTLGELLAILSQSGFIPILSNHVIVVVFRNGVVGTNHTLGELFAAVPESDRELDLWQLTPEIRDLLETIAAAQEEEAFEEDLDSGVQSEAKLPRIPETPSMPFPPAASAPAPGGSTRGRVGSSQQARDESLSLPAPKSRSLPDETINDEVAARRATVRFYDRMNPQKVFPFMVTLTAEKVRKILQKRVSQVESKPFEVKLEEFLQIEPILPGCTCHPAKAELKITAADTAVQFWVVPQVLGQVKGAKVCISQEGQTLTEVELDIRIRRTTLAIILGLITLLYPVAAAIAQQFGIDFKNLGQLGEYLSLVNDYVRVVSPLFIFAGLIGLTGFLYWWSRPRQRDQFWDLDTEPGKR